MGWLKLKTERLPGVVTMSLCQAQPAPLEVGATSSSQTPQNTITYLDSVVDLVELLQWYYFRKSEIPDVFSLEKTYFPWLHHLDTDPQREFFLGAAKTPVTTPLVFNLITVNCMPPESPAEFRLINLIPFDHVAKAPRQTPDLKVVNRNFGHQLQLMMEASSFVLYGSDKDYLAHCWRKMQQRVSKGTIFVCHMESVDWSKVPKSLLQPLIAGTFIPSALLRRDCTIELPSDHCPLLAYEHALLFAVHSKPRIFDYVVVGSTSEFENMDKQKYKLIIQCHDSVDSLPSTATLALIFEDWQESTENIHFYLEFPSGSYAPRCRASFINTIKLIYKVIQEEFLVYLFSFDGFTGVSILLVALAKVMWKTSIEEAFLRLVAEYNVRIYLFKQDFAFLQWIEPLLDATNWLNANLMPSPMEKVTAHVQLPHKLQNELPPDQPIPHPVAERKLFTSSSLGTIQHTVTDRFAGDWFTPGSDVNFPACIIPNLLFLGSWNHASLCTVMETLQIKQVISLGDCPRWCAPLIKNKQFSELWCHEGMLVLRFDCRNQPGSPALVDFVIFIHNFNDDGRDSLLPLLFSCPSSVKRLLGFTKSTESKPRTLVHCRIGVLRSASVVIAHLMVQYNLLLVAAYLYVRVQRFNIIIQPNLRLMYGLWLWERYLHGGVMAWEIWALWIDSLNRHYIDVEVHS